MTSNQTSAPLLRSEPGVRLAETLAKRLASERIAYCVWKRTNTLERCGAGDGEIDLLVSRSDASRFTQILARLGFKEGKAPRDEEPPGATHYFGCDRHADRLVHLHVHYQVFAGNDVTKNYRLPVEGALLASVASGPRFHIAAPELELIVLVLRLVLKHSTWDSILLGQGTVPCPAREELRILRSSADRGLIHHFLETYLPVIDPRLFDACLRSLQADCRIRDRVAVARSLQARLRPYARRSRAAELGLNLWHLVARALRRRLNRLPRKQLVSGGAMIALVGGDGAGKSTAVEELHSWLGKDLETATVHLGKPPRSWCTWVARAIARIIDQRALPLFRPWSEETSGVAAGASGYGCLLTNVCTAWDRLRSFRRARRFASKGGLVVCDRFPLPYVILMDHARSRLVIGPRRVGWFAELLISREQRCYDAFLPPEVLIVLRVDPAIGSRRSKDGDAAVLRERCQEIWDIEWEKTPAHVVDVNRPREEVLSDLKSLVWSEL